MRFWECRKSMRDMERMENKMNCAVRHFLDGMWNLSFTLPEEDKKVETQAAVPGNVEPVLVELGLIEDYLPVDFEHATAKFETVDDWTYMTSFDGSVAKEGWTQQLVFEGIDTLAEIYLNDALICNCCDMHMTYKVDVKGKLQEKNNQLKVVIRSSELWARNHAHDMFVVGAHGLTSYFDSQTYLRKARHQWGWDNAPRLITSGITRSVYLEELPPCRFEEIYLFTKKLEEDYVKLGATFTYTTSEKYILNHKVRLTLLDGEEIVHEEIRNVYHTQGSISYEVPRDKVRLWWPSGFGDPDLYTVKIEMLKEDEVVAVYEDTFGIRTLRLEMTEDIMEDSTGEFAFRVNGEKVFVRGTNWKPLDPLASAADVKTKSERALKEITNLNCNMVRIWGGGIYEDKSFYDYCDRNGLMVWQDFMFACEIPPTDDEFCRLVKEEAIQIVKKLRNHACLATWCGDNEDDMTMTWAHLDTNVLPSHNVISRRILKDAVLHHDPYRSYVESSPYHSDTNFKEIAMGGKMTHFQPEEHLYPTTVRFAEALRNCKSFFIGETGPIQVNSIAVNAKTFEKEKTRAKRLWDTPLYPGIESSEHQNDEYFIKWRQTGKNVCMKYFGRDFSFAEWKDYTLAINVICAEVFKDALEYGRVNRWTKTGILWWSLTDMWPMIFNYSVSDYEFNKKLAYHWIRQSQQEFALMAVRKEFGGELALYAANDTLQPHTVEYTVTAYDECGKGRFIASGICRQEKNSASLIQRIAESDKPELWIMCWKEAGKNYINHVFTKNTSIETMRSWVEIIGQQGGFADEILELK